MKERRELWFMQSPMDPHSFHNGEGPWLEVSRPEVSTEAVMSVADKVRRRGGEGPGARSGALHCSARKSPA